MGLMYLSFALLALLATAAHLALERRSRNARGVVEALLLYTLVFVVGVQGLWTAAGHLFKANQVAAMTGWPPGSPFQFDVGIANLAVGVLGTLCLWLRGNFWTATVVVAMIWLWGDAIDHLRDIVVSHNLAPGNAGPTLFADILIPAVLVGLLIAHGVDSRRTRVPYARFSR